MLLGGLGAFKNSNLRLGPPSDHAASRLVKIHSIFWIKTLITLSYRPVQRGGAPPKIDCQVSAWSEWTDCTVSCGVGWTTVIRTFKKMLIRQRPV